MKNVDVSPILPPTVDNHVDTVRHDQVDPGSDRRGWRVKLGIRKLTAAAVALLAVATGCSSSTKLSGTGAARHSIKVGVLIDLTGLAASANASAVEGIKAGVLLAKDQGWTIDYVTADTASSPSGALTAAEKLVEQDHVLAVLALSSLTFAAASYLNSHHVPVVGLAADGPEWATDMNMFSIGGPIHTNLVPDIYGKFFKMEGVTTVGTLGYSISPTSSQYAKAVAESAKLSGLTVGYQNENFPFGSTNVGPVALAMKNAGVDGVYAPIDPNTAFALVTALRQAGANPKVALFATGYGGDLLQAGPDANQVAQGVYFVLGVEPVELQTTATKKFTRYLSEAGISTEPTFGEYDGYTTVGLLLRGLEAAGTSPSAPSLINALSHIHNWDDLGLWGGRTLDINNRTAPIQGPGNCAWITRFEGRSFQLVAGANPICGQIVGNLDTSS
jgi:ABC-type branched-subunit amino acid transport system substrate-binding protein